MAKLKKESVFHRCGNLVRRAVGSERLVLWMANLADNRWLFLRYGWGAHWRRPFEKKVAASVLQEFSRLAVNRLLMDLDDLSRHLVDTVLERCRYIVANEILDEHLFTREEKKAQRKINLRPYIRKYPGLDTYPPETFYYHSGLKFVPPESVARLKGSLAIDAGAYQGDSVLVFSHQYDFQRILALEPDVDNFEKLKTIKHKFRLGNVVPIAAGLSAEPGATFLSQAGSASRVEDFGLNQIRLETIDRLMKKEKYPLGLIKMDIEGAEYSAVCGARESIKRFKPVLLISLYHTGQDFFKIKPCLAEIRPDYRFSIRKINPFSLINETILIAY